jgi:small subunit ribosomal protein S9
VPATTFYGTGRRKSSTARVFLKPGSGEIVMRGASLEKRFTSDALLTRIKGPLLLTEQADKVDILATAKGGGTTGQADALRLGIARALIQLDPELRPVLKKAGMLTRDARIKERKKYGLAGARKRFQFSKR